MGWSVFSRHQHRPWYKTRWRGSIQGLFPKAHLGLPEAAESWLHLQPLPGAPGAVTRAVFRHCWHLLGTCRWQGWYSLGTDPSQPGTSSQKPLPLGECVHFHVEDLASLRSASSTCRERGGAMGTRGYNLCDVPGPRVSTFLLPVEHSAHTVPIYHFGAILALSIGSNFPIKT